MSDRATPILERAVQDLEPNPDPALERVRKVAHRRRTVRRWAAGATGLLVAAFGLTVAALSFDRPDRHHGPTVGTPTPDVSPTVARTSPSSGLLPPIPNCGPAPDNVGDRVELTIPEGPLRFDPTCIYAPADASFDIVFANLVTVLHGGQGVESSVAIYPDQASAVHVINERALGIGPENHRTAFFIGRAFTGPGTIEYHVPALPPGTYYVQSDDFPDRLGAVLVVGRGGPPPRVDTSTCRRLTRPGQITCASAIIAAMRVGAPGDDTPESASLSKYQPSLDAPPRLAWEIRFDNTVVEVPGHGCIAAAWYQIIVDAKDGTVLDSRAGPGDPYPCPAASAKPSPAS